jgi:hypothetical protein
MSAQPVKNVRLRLHDATPGKNVQLRLHERRTIALRRDEMNTFHLVLSGNHERVVEMPHP